MNAAIFAIIGAVVGAAVTGAATVTVAYMQRAAALRDAHRLRAFDRHLASYEQIFVTARSVLDAFNDYEAIDKRVSKRTDPFLHQLLDILNDCCYQYCSAVDWRHHSGMAYLEMKLEETCLHLRDLLLQWLSRERISYGDVATIRRNGITETISKDRVKSLNVGDYQELTVERHIVVTSARGDAALLKDIRSSAIAVIKELKDVMAY